MAAGTASGSCVVAVSTTIMRPCQAWWSDTVADTIGFKYYLGCVQPCVQYKNSCGDTHLHHCCQDCLSQPYIRKPSNHFGPPLPPLHAQAGQHAAHAHKRYGECKYTAQQQPLAPQPCLKLHGAARAACIGQMVAGTQADNGVSVSSACMHVLPCPTCTRCPKCMHACISTPACISRLRLNCCPLTVHSTTPWW